MFKRNAVNISFFIISLIVFAYFFRVMNWLDEQFSVWSSYYEIFLSGALPLKMSPYASTLVPVSIAYFTVTIFYFMRYYKNPFFITKRNYPLAILNIIYALFSCLAYFELISEMTAITITGVTLSIIFPICIIIFTIIHIKKKRKNASQDKQFEKY